MSELLENTRIELIDALRHATAERKLEWIRINPDEAKCKEGTIEQRYAMLSEDGIFATLSRMRNGALELLIQVQETGAYREYEVTKADGPVVVMKLSELYMTLPSTAKMIDDFHMIIDKLKGPML